MKSSPLAYGVPTMYTYYVYVQYEHFAKGYQDLGGKCFGGKFLNLCIHFCLEYMLLNEN